MVNVVLGVVGLGIKSPRIFRGANVAHFGMDQQLVAVFQGDALGINGKTQLQPPHTGLKQSAQSLVGDSGSGFKSASR